MALRERMKRYSFGLEAAHFPIPAAALVGALFACSSPSSPHPPLLTGCTEKNGVPCTDPVVSGAPSHADDGGSADDAASSTFGDAASCTGATKIFGTSTAACIACIAASCCSNPTSCPNDTSCSSIAFCILNCLPTDPSCVHGCEALATSAIVTEFTDLASCSTSHCPMCPTLKTAAGDL